MGGHRRSALVLVFAALVLVLTPRLALAQTGSISGVVRDSQGGVLPGVTVEVTSPQLIEKVRSTVTDDNGRYQISGCPVGKYTVSFKLEKFATVERSMSMLTSDFTAPVNADMKLGATTEVVTVQVAAARAGRRAERPAAPGVLSARNWRTCRSRATSTVSCSWSRGLRSPRRAPATARRASAAAARLTPASAPRPATRPAPCPAATRCMQTFNAHASINDPESQNQGRMQVDGLSIQRRPAPPAAAAPRMSPTFPTRRK